MSTSVQQLSYSLSDPEMRFGLKAGPGTSVRTLFAGAIALPLTTILFVAVYLAPEGYFRSMLLERGPTQYAAVFLACWCIVILLLKRRKLQIQKAALATSVVPVSHDFVLSSYTADLVLANIREQAEDPDRFILFNRINLALSNLKNLGRVSDLDDVLRALAERDESVHQTSFASLSGFLWSIPVLGFIGTVLGLANSIGSFSNLLEQQSDFDAVLGSLRTVTAGLSTAFETTLLALVLALILQLWVTSQRIAEETFLDECDDYCLRRIVSRIKIIPTDRT